MAKRSTQKHPPAGDEHEPRVSKALQEEFIRFLEYHPAQRFNRNLRRMVLEFMMYDGALEAPYLKDLLLDLEGLFELLDVAEKEWKEGS